MAKSLELDSLDTTQKGCWKGSRIKEVRCRLLKGEATNKTSEACLSLSITRSSSREVRIRVPFFLWSILAGEPSPQKRGSKRAPLGDLDKFWRTAHPSPHLVGSGLPWSTHTDVIKRSDIRREKSLVGAWQPQWCSLFAIRSFVVK